MTSIQKINLLLDELEKNINNNKTASLRENNLIKMTQLFERLNIAKKHDDFTTLFDYTAMNLAGIGLKNEDFGEIREGKYVQIIAVSSHMNSAKKTTKNISLGYYGKAEKLEEKHKSDIIEFVLRWRYEKSFLHSDYYEALLSKRFF